MPATPRSRRPIKTRSRGWARGLASRLTHHGVSPNAISLASLVVAALATLSFVLIPHTPSRITATVLAGAAAICIQLRLLANMLDGLVAVEGGRHTATGDLFNEVPDRLADILVLAGAGYSITWFPDAWLLGWLAALAAVLTAYIRLLGGSLQLPQDYCGPMAKSHRMALLSAACIGTVVECVVTAPRGYVLAIALALILSGSLLTSGRRLRHIATALEQR